jgi:hypothetical protein
VKSVPRGANGTLDVVKYIPHKLYSMATPTRFLRLTAAQDDGLRELEGSPVVNAKVPLRASIIRLNSTSWSAPKVAQHFGRNLQSVHNDLDRFEQLGIEGLADGKATGAR